MYNALVRHIRLVVEYDGTSLCGWQRQTTGPTVQEHLETALASLLQHEVTVAGASRTDAGVHARGQVATFRTERPIPLHGVRRGLNSMLPESISVTEASEVPDDFHPRHSATGKHYRYTILTRPDRSPRWRDRAWHHPDPIDPTRMREGALVLLGEHDFAAFRAAGCAAKTTVRRIYGLEITPEDDRLIVDIRGTAFLRMMVRIIVGTLTEVGSGKRTVAQLSEILASKDRNLAGITAPAHGLELMSVAFDGTRTPRRPKGPADV